MQGENWINKKVYTLANILLLDNIYVVMEEQLDTLCFHQKFQNFQMGANGKGNFLEKFPENLKIVKFLKHYPFNWKFQDENQMEQKFLVTCFENSGQQVAG